MALGRRDFVKLAASAGALPLLSHGALAQLAPNPPSIRPPSPAERAAMGRLALSFMDKFEVPALSFAIGYAGAIVIRPPLALPIASRMKQRRRSICFASPASAR